MKNTTRFESSVLFRVLDAQICSLQRRNPVEQNYCLLGRQLRVSGAINGWIADECVSGGVRLHCDDIVCRGMGGVPGVVLACLCNDGGTLYLKVEVMRRVRAGVWSQTVQQDMWIARDAVHPVGWRELDEGVIVVIE